MMKIIHSNVLAGIAVATLLASFGGVVAPAQAVYTSGGLNVSASANGGTNVDANAGVSANAETRTGLSATVGATLASIIQRAEERADQEITRRIDAMNEMETRINGMARISSTTQASIVAGINAQISALTTLKARIMADASSSATSSLKADIKSIVQSYRIFALILPRAAIDAAAGRIEGVGTDLSTLAGKLQARVTEAQTAGANVTAAASALADMNAQITNANVSVQAAVNEVASLTPDNGDENAMRANVTALQDARSKIVAAQHDLNTARSDARSIVNILAELKVSASTTANGTGNQQ